MWLQILTDCNGNAQNPAAANRLISFSFCVCLCVFSSVPPTRPTPSILSSRPPPVSCLACPYFSSAWNGDWKPPKVRWDCHSQKQPAQQPCKSNRGESSWFESGRKTRISRLLLLLCFSPLMRACFYQNCPFGVLLPPELLLSRIHHFHSVSMKGAERVCTSCVFYSEFEFKALNLNIRRCCCMFHPSTKHTHIINWQINIKAHLSNLTLKVSFHKF